MYGVGYQKRIRISHSVFIQGDPYIFVFVSCVKYSLQQYTLNYGINQEVGT
jgi:hypothetical protein